MSRVHVVMCADLMEDVLGYHHVGTRLEPVADANVAGLGAIADVLQMEQLVGQEVVACMCEQRCKLRVLICMSAAIAVVRTERVLLLSTSNIRKRFCSVCTAFGGSWAAKPDDDKISFSRVCRRSHACRTHDEGLCGAGRGARGNESSYR